MRFASPAIVLILLLAGWGHASAADPATCTAPHVHIEETGVAGSLVDGPGQVVDLQRGASSPLIAHPTSTISWTVPVQCREVASIFIQMDLHAAVTDAKLTVRDADGELRDVQTTTRHKTVDGSDVVVGYTYRFRDWNDLGSDPGSWTIIYDAGSIPAEFVFDMDVWYFA